MVLIERELTCWGCHGSGVVADENQRCVRCPMCDGGRLKVVPASQLRGAVEVLRERRDAWPKASHPRAILDSALREVERALNHPGGVGAS